MSKENFSIPPIVIQSGELIRFEAPDMDDMRAAVALSKKEILPHTFEDIDPSLPKRAPQPTEAATPAGDTTTAAAKRRGRPPKNLTAPAASPDQNPSA